MAVNKNKQRVEEIKKTFDERRNGRASGSAEQQALRNKLSELRNQFQALLVRNSVSTGPMHTEKLAMEGMDHYIVL